MFSTFFQLSTPKYLESFQRFTVKKQAGFCLSFACLILFFLQILICHRSSQVSKVWWSHIESWWHRNRNGPYLHVFHLFDKSVASSLHLKSTNIHKEFHQDFKWEKKERDQWNKTASGTAKKHSEPSTWKQLWSDEAVWASSLHAFPWNEETSRFCPTHGVVPQHFCYMQMRALCSQKKKKMTGFRTVIFSKSSM